MCGGETPRSDKLGQCFEFFKDTTGPNATGLQKVLVSVVIGFSLVAAMAVIGSVVWGMNLLRTLPYAAGVVTVLGGAGWTVVKRRRAPAAATGGETGAGEIGEGEPK
ncbi:hypothetical protein CLV71_13119 [Actinophytocola oryzae]|uniref:Uncharacterized protein n=1 Tax=Actinophytocola oryzae TaxID=502181 RepID=A0A4R7UQX0_9PSEU|nr:hypothetical protein CLV71_13119 [Actinophytocola oryzae]